MAIPDHKTRYSVTLDNRLIETMQAEAKQRGVAGSQLATHIIEQYFFAQGKYIPEETKWRQRLKEIPEA